MSYLNSKPVGAKELFVIDGSLPDIPTLVDAIGADKWIVVLDPQRDGVWQLAEIVSPELDLSAIHVLSHGAAGSLSLGTALLNQASLPIYAEALQSIGQALSDSGDILLYGCEVAQGDLGQSFIAQLATATGADVAASSNLTGPSERGGDWLLESASAAIDAPTAPIGANYAYTLGATETLNFAVDNASLWSGGSGFSFSHTFDQLVFSLDPISTSGTPSAEIAGSTVGLDYALNATNMQFGLPITIGLSAGTFDLSYPVQAQIGLPSQVRPGDTFTITTSPGVATLPAMEIDGPSPELAVDAILKANISGHLGLTWDLPGFDPDAIAVWGAVDENLVFSDRSLIIDQTIGLYDLTLNTRGFDTRWQQIEKINETIQGERDVYHAPNFTAGIYYDPAGLDGTSTVLPQANSTLADFSVSLHQSNPMFFLELDIDDALSFLDPKLAALDYEGQATQSVFGVPLGIGGQASLLSLNLVVGVSPALKVDFDIQDVAVTLSPTSGESQSGYLGQSFDFVSPATGDMSITTHYSLNGVMTVTPGLFFEVSYKADIIGAEGQIVTVNIPQLFDGNKSFYLARPSQNISSNELFDDAFSISHAVSINLSGKDYALNWGDTTIESPVSTPGSPIMLSVSIVDADDVEEQGVSRVAEGDSGTRDVTFVVTRSGDLSTTTTAAYSFDLGDGVDSSDYTSDLPIDGTITFAAGESRKEITLSINGDQTAEADERLTFNLSSSAQITTPATTLVIHSDDERLITGSGEIFGTVLDDVIIGSDRSDYIYAGPGNDLVDAITGSDTIFGGSGNDLIALAGVGGDYQSDWVDGGAGLDQLDLNFANESGYFTLKTYTSETSTTPVTLTSASSHDAIQTALSTAVRFAYDGVRNDLDWRGIETLNITTGSGGDLLVYQNGTSYQGGTGTDTFYADWSGATQAIVWDNDPANPLTLANGVTVGGFERLLLTTGSGDDVIKNTQLSASDHLATGAGDDLIALAGVGGDYQSDWVDGGAGLDQLDLNFANDSGYFTLKTYTSETSTTPVTLTSASSHDAIQTALSTAVRFAYDGVRNDLDWRGIETLNITTGSGGDLLVYHNGTRYLAGTGFDTFYADWSGATQAIVWDNDPANPLTLANGVTVGGFERLLLTTGSGDDVIKNTQLSASDHLATGAGDDLIALAGVGTAYQSDWVDGGTGLDHLDVDYSNDTGDFKLDTYPSDSSDAHATVNVGSTHGAIQTALSTAVRFAYDGLRNDLDWRGIETLNITTGSGSDLLVYHNGTRYLAGTGFDTFYADWSGATQAIEWDNDPANPLTLANGVTVGGFERLLLTTGSGNDVIKNTQLSASDHLATGAGDDLIALAGVGTAYQSDWVDGGTGLDHLDVDYSNDTGDFKLDTYPSESSDTHATVNTGSTHGAIQTALSTAVRFAYDGLRNDLDWRGIETLNLTTGSGDDLLVYHNGTRYLAGAGFDTFYADWSAATQAIVWDNDPANPLTLANGVTVGGFERLLLTTGSGNDVIKNTLLSASDHLATGAGDDLIALAGVGTAYQSDWVDGGTGLDQLDLNFANDSGYFTLKTYTSETSTTPVALTSASSHDAIQTALSTAVRFAYDGQQNDVEWRGIETVNVTTGRGGDLLVYQNGTSYQGGTGTDTFYADWSGATQAIVWDNDPANPLTLGNGVTVGGFERLLLTTGSGDDVIKNTGTSAADWINAGAGNDLLDGGAGDDLLTGGAGRDIFQFAPSGNGVDQITDFEIGDVLRIAGASLSNDSFVASALGLGSNQVAVSSASGITTIQIGTDAAAGADVTIKLTGTFSASALSARGTDISLVAPNHAPTGAPTAALPSGSEGTPYSLSSTDLLAGFSDADGDTLAVSNLATAVGVLVDNENGTWTLTAPDNYNGPVLLIYDVVDGRGGLVAASQSFSLAPVNDLPSGVATGTLPAGTEDSDYVITTASLVEGFSDADGDLLAVANLTADHGTLLNHGDGTWTFKSDENYHGLVSLTYDVIDGNGGSISATQHFELAPVNDAPTVAQAIADQTAMQDAPFAYAMPATIFADVDAGDTLTYSATLADGSALPSWLSFDSTTRTFSGTPGAFDVGELNIRVTATDTGSASVSDVFTLAIDNINDAPTGTASAILSGGIEDTDYLLTAASLLEGFSDADGDLLTVANLVADHGALTDHGDGTWTLTPEENYHDPVSLAYDVIDGKGGSIAATQHFALAPVNDAPTVSQAIADQTAMQDVSFAYVIPTTIFADVDTGDTLTYSATLADGSALPSWLSFDTATRTFSGTPGAFDVAVLDIRITATDSGNASASDVFKLTIENTNDAPTGTANAMLLSGIEDTDYLITAASLLEGFSDADGDLLVVANLAADRGALSDNGNGTWTFTPEENYHGLVSLAYDVIDGNGGAIAATQHFDLAAVNDAPTVAQQMADQTATQDAPFAYAVPATTFTDVDAGDTLTYGASLADGSALPSWLGFDSATRTFSGTPGAFDISALDIRVTAMDSGNASASDIFTLTINNTNDAPTGSSSAILPDGIEDTDHLITAASLLEGFSDADGDPLAVANLAADHGALSDNGNGTWTLTPEENYHGPVSLAYDVIDGKGGSIAAAQHFDLAAVNDAPTIAQQMADQTATQNAPFAYLVPADTFTEVDAGDSLTFTASLADGSALPLWLGFDAATRTFSGTPGAFDVRALDIRVTATDDVSASASDVFTLTIDNINDAPTGTASAILPNGFEDTDYLISAASLLEGFSDADGDPLGVTDLAADHGTLLDHGDGTWTITPDENYFGPLSLSYSVVDGKGGSVAAMQNVVLVTSNDAPTLARPIDDQNATQGVPFAYAVPPTIFTDVDSGDTLTFSASLADGSPLPSWLSFDGGTRTFSGTPGAFDVRALDIRVTATDGGAASASDVFTLTVENVNDAPVGTATATLPTGAEDLEYRLTAAALLEGFSDVDGDTLSVTNLVADLGTLVDGGNGEWTYTPTPNYNGPVSLGYDVIDGNGGAIRGTQRFELRAVNDAPIGTATAVLPVATEGTPYSIGEASLLAGFSDVDRDLLSVADLVASHGLLVRNIDGTWTFTAATGYSGPVELAYNVIDGSGGTVAASQRFNVQAPAPNHAPTAMPDSAETLRGVSIVLPVRTNDHDPDADALTISAVTQGSNGAVSIDASTGDPRYTPNAGFIGTDSFSYTVADGHGGSSTTTVSMIVASLLGDGNANTLTGTSRYDVIVGRAGDDTLTGAGGNDLLFGGDGTDRLRGGAGADGLNGDAGDDVFQVSGTELTGDRIDGGTGHDTLTFIGNVTLGAARFQMSDVEALDMGGFDLTVRGTSVLDLSALTLANGGEILGDSAANTIIGTQGNDYVNGGGGGDLLRGGLGSDSILGGKGGDVIWGEAGNDQLYGGTSSKGDGSADTFVFSTLLDPLNNVDTVYGFEANARDRIAINPTIFAAVFANGTAVLDSTEFRASAGGNAMDTDDFILFDTNTGTLYFDEDGSGAIAKLPFAVLIGVSGTLDFTDFTTMPLGA